VARASGFSISTSQPNPAGQGSSARLESSRHAIQIAAKTTTRIIKLCIQRASRAFTAVPQMPQQ
jgi:hypothetical protein